MTSAAFRILVTDGISREGVALLEAVPEFTVDVVPTLPPAELVARIGGYDALIGRSATRVTEDVLRAGRRLLAIGRAGAGVDNIALDAATELGIAVINTPGANSVAVAELFFGSLIGLLRQIPRADRSIREGRWERATLTGVELKGRCLGIVGVGRIGREVALRARAFGMVLAGYDPYVPGERFDELGIRRVDRLDDLLAGADVLTIHAPLTDETRGMIGALELGRMKPGAIVANLARGGIVDEGALVAALRAGTLDGAIVDAFCHEPLTGDHPFRDVPRTVLTPHLGASTAEAQDQVAVDACAAVREALLEQELSRTLNVAPYPEWRALQGALRIARSAASVARAILAEEGERSVSTITVKAGPELVAARGPLLAAAALGTLDGVTEAARLNLINARRVAEARGLELQFAEGGVAPHDRAVEVRLAAGGRTARVGGVAAVGATPRLTRIGDFHVDVAPRGTLIVLANDDVPGVIGHVGSALGAAGVNIAEYHQARLAPGGAALAAIVADGPLPSELHARLRALPHIRSAAIVPLGPAT